MTPRVIGAACLAVVLALGACGDSDGNGPSADGTTPTTTGGGITVEPGTSERATPTADAPVTETAAALNQLGYRLMEGIGSDDNAVFSPASIGHTLLMAREAADESASSAIDAASGLPAGLAAHDAWNAVDQAITAAAASHDELTVAIADRIWPRLDVTPSQDWIDLLATRHGADVELLDFGDEPTSRRVINDWVSERTAGLIPDLLPEGFIQPETVLVLTDALYFEADWRTPFGKYGFQEAPFHLLDGTTVNTELMIELENTGRAGVGDGWLAAEIPYVGNDFAMLVVVPDEGRWDDVRSRLGTGLVEEVDGALGDTAHELALPRWSTHTEIDLLGFLTELGAAPGAYPGISPEAFLAAAVHGADIAVDEWGTVAAAATAFGFDESAAGPPELIVRADRPYLYLIRHVPSGLVLFLGQVTDPTA